jgi:hypothetical protein
MIRIAISQAAFDPIAATLAFVALQPSAVRQNEVVHRQSNNEGFGRPRPVARFHEWAGPGEQSLEAEPLAGLRHHCQALAGSLILIKGW